MTELIIVRHGETLENILNICQGQNNGTLSDHGKEQNVLLAQQLKSQQIDIAYCSPLSRAVDTAKQVLKYHNDISLHHDKRIMEWNMGTLQGKEFPKNFDITDNKYSMETMEQVADRVRSFLNHIIKCNANKSILITSHGLTIRVIHSILLQIDFSKTILVKNSSFKYFYTDK